LSIDPANPRFLFDENVPRELGLVAAEQGFDIAFLVDSAIGDADEDVLARGMRERRIVITEDNDFGRLVFKCGEPCHGLILIRIAPWKREIRKARFGQLLEQQAGRLSGHFTVLAETTLRSRPIDAPQK
jgi:predicted nuclease of predicted toxin-antitoxin system